MAHPDNQFSRRTVMKAGLGAAAVAVAGTELFTAQAAQAAPDPNFPWIVDCDTWGARPPSYPLQRTGNITDKIIVHHMDFPNVTDYSYAQAVKLAKDCQDLHMDTNGWSDTGQHFTVTRGGYVMEGRHLSLQSLDDGHNQVIAAHCPGENGNAIGIESEGTYITELPTAALLDSLVRLCAATATQFGLHAWDIFGHWDFYTTDCPGIAYYKIFPSIRTRVLHEMGTPSSQIPDRRWPDIWRFVDGPVVQLAQYLLDAQGYTLTPDGDFGYDMNAAVADFQANNGIPVDPDAKFDAATWEALVPTLDKHATGLPVSGLQAILLHKGYTDIVVNGTFDHATMKAVQDIQHIHGLIPNGKVNVDTWCAVSGGIVRSAFRC